MPYPSSQASHAPLCGGSADELLITPAVSVHGAVLAPFSNPGLPRSCVGALELTVRLMVVVCVKLPEAPVTVTVAGPVVAVLLAVSVSVLVLVVLAGLKLAVTPLGSPEAESATVPLKPFILLTVTVLAPLFPCTTVRLLGEAESV